MDAVRRAIPWHVTAVRALAAILVVLALVRPSAAAGAQEAPRVVVGGRVLSLDPPPRVVEGRVLVPLRALGEALGARVVWEPQDRTVTVQRGGREVRLLAGRRLACLEAGCARAALLDVPPLLVEGRTWLPLRFAAEALGVAVTWEAATRTVRVDPARPPATAPQPLRLVEPVPGARIAGGPVRLRVALAPGWAPPEGSELRFFLLDPATGLGPLIARGGDAAAAFRWIPDPAYDGPRVLAAALYDPRGRFLAGDAVPVRVAVEPRVALRGLQPGQVVADRAVLAVELNFAAALVRYERVAADGTAAAVAEADPYAPFTWVPRYTDNGTVRLRAVAVDRLGRETASPPVEVTVQVPRRLALTGVVPGARIARPVTLGVAANFPVAAVRFVLRDGAGGEVVLGEVRGGGTLRWLPAPDQAGPRVLVGVVQDGVGGLFETPPVPVEVAVGPAVFVETVGPGQVLAGEVVLRALANVPLAGIEYVLTDPARGLSRRIAGGADAAAAYRWRPEPGDAGTWQLRAVGLLPDGGRVEGEAIPVRVHVGPLYGPQPVAPREEFVARIQRLAQESRARTGMSAALQVAQAILESGWGQSVPVDRYTGRVSYNLFGIKGTGPAGAVVSTTWEEYHGVVYRVDARFRAYRSVEESWADHKRLLLEAPRYAPFRAVMHDPLQGAWALRRAGYATDSRYPVKLIQIMQRHGLFALDEVAP